jgi:hypothetical protein
VSEGTKAVTSRRGSNRNFSRKNSAPHSGRYVQVSRSPQVPFNYNQIQRRSL